MAKSSRASSRQANGRLLKQKVFGPVEAARTKRLAAKLEELVKAPKPPKEGDGEQMDIVTQGMIGPKQYSDATSNLILRDSENTKKAPKEPVTTVAPGMYKPSIFYLRVVQ